ncbi:MAG: DUF3108 domain-containing protein, partial [Burkholderiaceae bacterium]
MVVVLNRSVGPAPRRRRRLAWVGVLALVLVVHAGVTQFVLDRLPGLRADPSMPARMQVRYIRDMALATPAPTAAPAAPPAVVASRAVRPRPPKPARPASAPQPAAEPEPAPAVESAEQTVAAIDPDLAIDPVVEVPTGAADDPVPPPEFGAPEAVEPAASTVAPAATAASAGAPNFEWPVSTRVSYVLTGNYRGEVHGSAQVEWVRVGTHYQVHLDLIIGPRLTPLITRSMTSDGEITADGLAPRRYDQDTKVAFRDRQRVSVRFEPDGVLLANGARRGRTPGLQDTASQFVQLTYLFSTRPDLLRVGGTVDVPLALPYKINVWTYDMVEEETLYTPFGALDSLHLKPRHPARGGGDLSAEIWYAP